MNKVEQDAALLIGSLQLECIKLRAMVAERDAEIASLKETISKVVPMTTEGAHGKVA